MMFYHRTTSEHGINKLVANKEEVMGGKFVHPSSNIAR